MSDFLSSFVSIGSWIHILLEFSCAMCDEVYLWVLLHYLWSRTCPEWVSRRNPRLHLVWKMMLGLSWTGFVPWLDQIHGVRNLNDPKSGCRDQNNAIKKKLWLRRGYLALFKEIQAHCSKSTGPAVIFLTCPLQDTTARSRRITQQTLDNMLSPKLHQKEHLPSTNKTLFFY